MAALVLNCTLLRIKIMRKTAFSSKFQKRTLQQSPTVSATGRGKHSNVLFYGQQIAVKTKWNKTKEIRKVHVVHRLASSSVWFGWCFVTVLIPCLCALSMIEVRMLKYQSLKWNNIPYCRRLPIRTALGCWQWSFSPSPAFHW